MLVFVLNYKVVMKAKNITAEEYVTNFNVTYFFDWTYAKMFALTAVGFARKEEREKALLAFSEVSKYCDKCNKKCSSDCSISCLEGKFKELINK